MIRMVYSNQSGCKCVRPLKEKSKFESLKVEEKVFNNVLTIAGILPEGETLKTTDETTLRYMAERWPTVVAAVTEEAK